MLIIFLFVVTLLCTAGCSDVGHKPLTFDIWVLKIDADGNQQWTTTIGGDPNGMGTEMIQTHDGGYAYCGYSHPQHNDRQSHGRPKAPLRVVRLDKVGEVVWDATFDIGNHRPVHRSFRRQTMDLLSSGSTLISE